MRKPRRNRKHLPPDVQQAMKLLIRAMYEGGDEEACRKAAEIKLMPYRKGMGI